MPERERHAFLNGIATAVPQNDVHEAFVRFARGRLHDDARGSRLFERMVKHCGIEHRYSFLVPGEADSEALDADRFYAPGSFPRTAERMQFFERHAPSLAAAAVGRLGLGDGAGRITHLLVTCCTGLVSPGLDLELIDRCSLPGSVERVTLGFMGCYAAVNALRLARHIVRSESRARVLILSLELCTLHLQETADLEQMLSFLLWGDGAAACLVTAEPPGLRLDAFKTVLAKDTRDLMSWTVRDTGFDMRLSGRVPAAIRDALGERREDVLCAANGEPVDIWAVHPGGRSVIDAVEKGLDLPASALVPSREILRRYGNMSSPTILFVLERLMREASPGDAGYAVSFGPGLVAETMQFRCTR